MKGKTMPRTPRLTPLATLLLLPALLSTSCIRVGDFSHSATRYNEAVEEAQNKMLLLNIIRAKQDRPLYITDLSKVTGNIKLDLNSGGIDTDYGPHLGSLTGGKLTPSVDYAHNPTFDVNVLSTQEFMNGFMRPISKELLAYYWEQRWGQEFLLYLFVHKVVVRSVDDTTQPEENYENSPREPGKLVEKFEKFGQWVTRFVALKPRFVRKDVGIGPCLDGRRVGDLDDLVAATKEGLTITAVEPGRYQLQQAKPDLSLMSEAEADRTREGEAVCKRAEKEAQPLEDAAEEIWNGCEDKLNDTEDESQRRYLDKICNYRMQVYDRAGNGELECLSCPREAEVGAADGSKPSTGSNRGAPDRTPRSDRAAAAYTENGVKKEATLYLRSPDGILYYLGELMRLEEDAGLVPEICYGDYREPLFVALNNERRGQGAEPQCLAAVTVKYQGSEFIIPENDPAYSRKSDRECAESEGGAGESDASPAAARSRKYLGHLNELNCKGGQSMHALSLLTQLIALQKSVKDAPTTSVIRAISQ